ncbi:DUF4238 domain-containing protein [Chitinophaga sp.]|uniref:DUF4238 domain-containing protein n=1 Tax=Chitinophaga sp. TaxID=1869181 RepID=UPI0031D6D8E4
MTHNAPKKHHFVPVCYLRTFTNAQKSFWKKRIDNGRISITTPSKVCYEEDANRFNVEQSLYFNGITDEYHIEKHAFKFQENNYGKIISKITTYQSEPLILEAKIYRLFIETLVTIKRRNPSFREGLINTFRQGHTSEEGVKKFKQFLAGVSECTGVEIPSDQKIREMLKNRAQDSSYLHDMYLTGYLNKSPQSGMSSVIAELYQLKQYILHAPADMEFITSDNPGFTFFENRVESATGFGREYEFYFPLSPKTCLYVTTNDMNSGKSSEKILYHEKTDSDKVRFINTATKKVSSKIIIAFSENVLVNI